jgi:hypothetical protein
MYRHHTGSQYTVMISKPPRPPSWRDFVPAEPPTVTPSPGPHAPKSRSKATTSSSSSKRASRDLEFTNLARQQKSYSEGSDLSRLGVGGQPHYHGSYSNLHRPGRDGGGMMGIGHSQTLPNPHTSKSGKRSHHRSHGRLHRTTSQYNIEQADLPRIESMTLSLANHKLQKKGAPGFDPLIYLDENAKRCERWLQQVHASQPLEDVSFTSKPPQLHIPEEGLDEHELVKTPVELCSGSGSEVDSVSVCAANRSVLSEREREAHIRLPGPHHPLASDNSVKNYFLGRPKPDIGLKDVAEESSTSTYSNQNNRLLVSKENRNTGSVSSSSEEVIQQRNNRKNLSDHGSPRDTRYVVDRGGVGVGVGVNVGGVGGEDANDIKLTFTR